MAGAEQHNFVAEELVRVAGQRAADTHASTDVAIQVIVVVIVMAVEVVLHPRASVGKVVLQ